MKLPFSSFFLLILVVHFNSCTRIRNNPVTYSGFVQGSTFMIRYFGGGDSLSLIRQIDSLFLLMNRTASLYDSGSMINRLNNNEKVELNDLFIRLTERSLEISEETGGAFDITVGPMVRAWGFYRKQGRDLPSCSIDSLKKLTGYKYLVVNGRKIIKKIPGIRLDFNAIAQGYTVDLVASLLENQGIHNYIIEIGGEVRASGKKPGDEPWIIGIEKPSENDSAGQVVQQRISLDGKSVGTSGNYRKFFIRDGRKYAHTIDPSTGYPVQHNLLSVTVIANDCMTADAYATACMVMGMEASKIFLNSHPGTEAYFICSDANNKMIIDFTPGFRQFMIDAQ